MSIFKQSPITKEKQLAHNLCVSIYTASHKVVLAPIFLFFIATRCK